MAHELAKRLDGTIAMAYAAKTGVPWHGLGQSLEEDASMDVWREAAGMDFEVMRSPAQFTTESGVLGSTPNHQVLYRSDTLAPLSVVSNRYKVVQPREIMDFFSEIAATNGFVMDTAGVLFGGKKYWALARTPMSINLQGVDEVKAHLMMATSCDGSMPTIAKYVATRVVCNNTLEISQGERGGKRVVVRHNTNFDSRAVSADLGLVQESWATMKSEMEQLAATTVTEADVMSYLTKLLGNAEASYQDQSSLTKNLIGRVAGLYDGAGIGASLSTSKGTAWGLLNSVTEYIDHQYGTRKDDQAQSRRLDNAWFSDGAGIKRDAYALALTLGD